MQKSHLTLWRSTRKVKQSAFLVMDNDPDILLEDDLLEEFEFIKIHQGSSPQHHFITPVGQDNSPGSVGHFKF